MAGIRGRKWSTTQRIDASREARLWLTTVVAPVAVGAAVLAGKYPEQAKKVKDWAGRRVTDVKNCIKSVKGKFTDNKDGEA